MDATSLNELLLVGSVVLLLAILAVRATTMIGLPSLLLFLGMGIALGDAGLGIEFSNPNTALALGYGALVVILAEGGLTTSWEDSRPSMPLGATLATAGLVITIAIMAVAAHFLLGWGWQLSVILGAVISSTDAAAVFSVLRRVPVPRRLVGVLEAESGLNDAPAVVIVALLSAGSVKGDGIWLVVGQVVYELAAGAVIGLAIGYGAGWLLRRVALPASGLYPLAVFAAMVLAYGVGTWLHASGFAAVFLAGLVLGNSDLPHRAASRSFAEGLAWLAQIGLFVMLGLLASPDRFRLLHVLIALVIGVVLTFVARPVCVAVCGAFFRMRVRDQAFLSWGGLRGAVPIVLTTIPLAAGVSGAQELFDVVFVMVVVFTIVTAPTLTWVARWLGVVEHAEVQGLEVEAAPLERIAADMLQVHVNDQSRLHGVEVRELRLPGESSVALVVRRGTSFTPDEETRIEVGDDLLVIVPRRVREATERRLQAVSQRGRLAGWVGRQPPRGHRPNPH